MIEEVSSRGVGASMVVAGLGFASWMQGWASPGLVVVAVFATALFFVGRERCESQAEACRAAEH